MGMCGLVRLLGRLVYIDQPNHGVIPGFHPRPAPPFILGFIPQSKCIHGGSPCPGASPPPLIRFIPSPAPSLGLCRAIISSCSNASGTDYSPFALGRGESKALFRPQDPLVGGEEKPMVSWSNGPREVLEPPRFPSPREQVNK
jgi:hypothetical protein